MFVRLGYSDLKIVFRDVGTILQYSSAMFLVPCIFSLLYTESFTGVVLYYVLSSAIVFLFGFILKSFFQNEFSTQMKHAFLITAVSWIAFTCFAALPFVFIQGASFVDGLFEAMSALTTTGLSVMRPLLDSMPRSLIFWRSLLSWVGGIGIIVLAMVGVFAAYTRASKLIIAEGREERLTPNLKNSVMAVWWVYALLTGIGALLLFLSGMTPFESMNYSMSAISTTGMDISSPGLAVESGYWAINLGIHNYWVDISLIIIMLFGATSFSVHYLFFKRKDIRAFFKDAEFRGLLLLSVLTSLMVIPKLGIENGIFHAVSALTCGGFELVVTQAIGQWDEFVKLVLVLAMFIGGSAGSTAGGIKISRFIIFVKGIYWKAKETLLPQKAFFAKKFDGREVKGEEIREVVFFILLYAFFIALGIMVLTFDGATISNSLFEVVSAQSNAGISTGITNAGMPLASKTMLIFNMWIGRLEIIPAFSLLGLAIYFVRRKRKQ